MVYISIYIYMLLYTVSNYSNFNFAKNRVDGRANTDAQPTVGPLGMYACMIAIHFVMSIIILLLYLLLNFASFYYYRILFL